MPDPHPSPRPSPPPAWAAWPGAAARASLAEPPDGRWSDPERAPFVELLRAAYAAGFAAGRRSRAP